MEMSSIQERAKIELDRIDNDPADTIVMLLIIKQFFTQWDSGGAVSVVIPQLNRLLRGLPLAPLTGEDDEWEDISHYDPTGPRLFQNKRCSSVFKKEVTVEGSGGVPGLSYWEISDIEAPGVVVFPYIPMGEGWAPPPMVSAGNIEDIEKELERAGHMSVLVEPISEENPAHPKQRYAAFERSLGRVINRHSMENASDTPDFIMAEFLTKILQAFDEMIQARDKWYGGSHRRLQAQLEAEGEHTAAANDQINELEKKLAELRRQARTDEARADGNGSV
jgi:hypothetical protein